MVSNEIDVLNLIEVFKQEIAMEGLEGCLLQNLVGLLMPQHGKEKHLDVSKHYHELMWRLVVNQIQINFFQVNATNKKAQKCVVTNSDLRGYCSNFETRICIDNLIRTIDLDPIDTFENTIKKFKSPVIIVANQDLRNSVLCPPHKNLKFENITDLEYCVLETIGKSRKKGIFTSGDGSLSHIFDLESKQLHYVLNILESHEFITKQSISAHKHRSIVYLAKYEINSETNLEKLTNYLLKKQGNCEERVNEIQIKLNFGTKKMKNLMALGEKQNAIERYMKQVEVDDQSLNEDEYTKKPTKTRQRAVRMVRLTESFRKKNSKLLNKSNADHSAIGDEDDDDETLENVDTQLVASLQRVEWPMYTQLFQYIERCGINGTSLKRLGLLFGLDFYKTRRMGSHLQTHPEVMTVIKETEQAKAKYQIIKLKKFVNKTTHGQGLTQQFKRKADLTIHNMVTERAVKRKKIIASYMEQRRICTKFEIDREIRRLEQLEGEQGQIDSKTSKRILVQMEKDGLVKLFSVNLKNVEHVAVRLAHITESDELYQNYIHTFSRTIEFCHNQKTKNVATNANSKTTANRVTDTTVVKTQQDSNNEQNSFHEGDEQFKLTRSYMHSIADKLDFSYSFAKIYGLVSKMQKSIVLHRFMHYLLFFYDGTRVDNFNGNAYLNTPQSHYIATNGSPMAMPDLTRIKAPPHRSLSTTNTKLDEYEVEMDIVSQTEPKTCYQQKLSWKSFIPPIRDAKHLPKNCLFVSDLIGNMPISVFTSICATHYKVPGLLSLLKHPYKRHMLLRDLPAHIVAPLIHERRYLQRLLTNLQILVCLGLISFVDNPNKEDSPNRNIHSQLVYVHRAAAFRDTTKNSVRKWDAIGDFDTNKYESLTFAFDKFDDLMEYWKKLLYVSLNTYKFNVAASLRESKKLRAALHRVACKQTSLELVEDPKPLKGDHLGPGGYDSQLFLNLYMNWVLPSPTNINTMANSNDDIIPCVEYNAKQPLECVYSELAMALPYGIYRGGNSSMSRKRTKRTYDDQSTNEDDDSNVEDEWAKLKTSKQQRKQQQKTTKNQSPNKKQKMTRPLRIQSKVKSASTIFKLKFSKYLVNRAKSVKCDTLKQQVARKPTTVDPTTGSYCQSKSKSKTKSTSKANNEIQRRSIWSKDEDDKILLIKVAALFFMPTEKIIQFKVIRDVFNNVFGNKGKSEGNKNEKAFGRRMKVLLKSRVNKLFVSNKLESCKHNSTLHETYRKVRLKRSSNPDEQIKYMSAFLNDMDKYVTDNGCQMDLNSDFVLPSTVKELYENYNVQSQKDVFKTEPHFQQPTCDYDIVKNTLHNAIHV